MECIYLKDAKYLHDYKIFVEFNNGKSGQVDLLDIIERYTVASQLKDLEKFAQFHLDSWPTLSWDCGFDIAPETLYEKCE